MSLEKREKSTNRLYRVGSNLFPAGLAATTAGGIYEVFQSTTEPIAHIAIAGGIIVTGVGLRALYLAEAAGSPNYNLKEFLGPRDISVSSEKARPKAEEPKKKFPKIVFKR